MATRERERDLELLIRERERDLELLIPVSNPENAPPKSSNSSPESPATSTTSTSSHSHHTSGREVSPTHSHIAKHNFIKDPFIKQRFFCQDMIDVLDSIPCVESYMNFLLALSGIFKSHSELGFQEVYDRMVTSHLFYFLTLTMSITLWDIYFLFFTDTRLVLKYLAFT